MYTTANAHIMRRVHESDDDGRNEVAGSDEKTRTKALQAVVFFNAFDDEKFNPLASAAMS